MNILLTGGAGFIGSHLCDRLLGSGHKVVALDDLSLGVVENIAHLRDNPKFVFIEGDASVAALVTTVVADHKIDCVFHLAANSDIARSTADPAVDLSKTFLTTFAVLEAMRLNGVKKIVFASTSAVYGDAPGFLKEDHGPLMPISHYGAAKLASEGFLTSYGENYGIQCWITRFPNVVGPRATHGAIYDFVHKLKKTPNRLDVLGDGSQVKPYIYVFDLVDAIMLAFEKSDEKVNVFNVGPETRTTVARIAELVVEASGRAAEIVYGGGTRGWVGDVPRFDYNTNKIRALGWAPSMTSDEAVEKTAQVLFGR